MGKWSPRSWRTALQKPVALQVRLEIRSEPQCSGLRTCQYFWKAAVKHIHLRSFRYTERKKLQDGGPASHRFGDALHQRRFLRSSEQPLPHPAGCRVDERTHITEKFGSILNFVEYDRRTQFFEECTWITANPSLNVGIFKKHVLDLREQLAEEGRLSGAAWSCYNQRREMPSCLSDHITQISRYIPHVSILRYNFRILNACFCFASTLCNGLGVDLANIYLTRSGKSQQQHLGVRNSSVDAMQDSVRCLGSNLPPSPSPS